MSEETELLKRAVAAFHDGAASGFDIIFRTWYRAVCHFAFRIVKDREAAEDVASDAFVKLWRTGTASPLVQVTRAYVFKIALNNSLQYLRGRKMAARKINDLRLVVEEEIDAPLLEELIRAESWSQVYESLQDLPPATRLVFEKLYVEDKSVKEIAQELSLSTSTIKTHKKRGLSFLKKRFTTSVILFFTMIIS